MAALASEGWDWVDLASPEYKNDEPELNDDDFNAASGVANLAHFEENLQGDQIQLKYFQQFSDQFNSFKVLKRPNPNYHTTQQHNTRNVHGKADNFMPKPYIAKYQISAGQNQGNQSQNQQARNGRATEVTDTLQMSPANASKRQSKSQQSLTKSPEPEAACRTNASGKRQVQV